MKISGSLILAGHEVVDVDPSTLAAGECFAGRTVVYNGKVYQYLASGSWEALATGPDLAAAEADITTIQGQISTLQTDVGAAETDIATLQTTVGTLGTDLDTAEADIAALESSVSTLQTDVSTLQADVAAIDTSTIESNVLALQTDLGTAQDDINTVEGDIIAIQGDVSTLQTSVAGKKDTFAVLPVAEGGTGSATGFSDLQSEVIAIDDALVAAEADIVSLQTDKLDKSGGTMTGAITLPGDPTLDLHAATKAYVDASAGGGGSTDNLTQTAEAVSMSGGAITATKGLVRITEATDADYTLVTINGLATDGNLITLLNNSGEEITFATTGNLASGIKLQYDEAALLVYSSALSKWVSAANFRTKYDLQQQTNISSLTTDVLLLNSDKLAKSGGTMTGALTLSGAPTEDLHAATKAYVDAGGGSSDNLAQASEAVTITAQAITVTKGLVRITSATDLDYVLATINGLAVDGNVITLLNNSGEELAVDNTSGNIASPCYLGDSEAMFLVYSSTLSKWVPTANFLSSYVALQQATINTLQSSLFALSDMFTHWEDISASCSMAAASGTLENCTLNVQMRQIYTCMDFIIDITASSTTGTWTNINVTLPYNIDTNVMPLIAAAGSPPEYQGVVNRSGSNPDLAAFGFFVASNQVRIMKANASTSLTSTNMTNADFSGAGLNVRMVLRSVPIAELAP